MKKTAILATAMAAALCLAPLAACGGGAEPGVKVDGKAFNLADYVTELPESRTVEGLTQIPKISSMKKLDLRLSFFSSTNYGEPIGVARQYGTGDNDGKYCLYDLGKGQSLSGWYTNITTISSSPFLGLATGSSDTDATLHIAYPTGELVTSSTFTSEDTYDISTDYGTYYADGESARYYSVTYPTGSSTATAYVAYKDGAWKKLTESDINAQPSTGGYEVGDTLGIVKTPLVEWNGGDEEDYPDYLYKDYSFRAEGSSQTTKITLYKGEEAQDSLFLFGGQSVVLGVVGKYFYYYDRQPVSTEAKSGYNVEITSYNTVEKYNMTLHRYDFVEGEDETVESDYIFGVSSSNAALYNKNAKDFDRLVVNAYKKANGVAVLSSGAPVYTVILDDEAKVSFDLTGKDVSGAFYQLSSTRFLSGSTIMDAEMNTVVALPSSYSSSSASSLVWEGQSLILCSTSSGIIAVDYDGTVKIAGIQSMSGVCDNTILGSNKNGESALFSKNDPTGTTLASKLGSNYSSLGRGLYYTSEDGTYTFYNCLGTKVGEFAAYSYLGNPTAYGEKYYLSTNDVDYNYVTLLFE